RCRAVRAPRSQAQGLQRQPPARRGRAGQGVAHRPDPAAARGAAHRRRRGADLPAVRQRRGDRAGPRRLLDRLRRALRAGRRAVAIALRNRWRRQQVPEHLRDEIAPKNIIMIGPTGVGKTEIARRLAKLVQAPFVKVEASKFTEVGYVGRDVDSMVRDLIEISVKLVKDEETVAVRARARIAAEDRLLDLLLPRPQASAPGRPIELPAQMPAADETASST